MEPKDLNRWAVPHDQLPRQLWFVRHGESQCYSEDECDSEDECPNDLSVMGGITAACPKAIFRCLRGMTNVVDIYRKIKRHLDWSSRRPSCFVSTFGVCSRSHDWAVQRGGTVRIYEIDTTKLPPMPFAHVFRPSDFNVNWPKDEYLFLHQIPDRAIECCYVMPDDYKAKHSRSAPSLPQSLNDALPNPEPSRKSDKRKREEDVVSSRKTRLRTNTGKAIGPTATSEGGDGKKCETQPTGKQLAAQDVTYEDRR